MNVKKALIILVVLYLISAVVFWYLYTHKKVKELPTNLNQQSVQRSENLTQEEKVIEAMNNMQKNSGSDGGSQQEVLDAFNNMK